jgi:hypothetical protein
MQVKEIIGLMTGQNAYDDKTLSGLSDVLKEYPYFQAAHLLYTFNFLALKDTRFSIELRKTAAYLSDRRKLFYSVENRSFPPDFIEKSEKQEETASASSFDLIELFLADKKTGEEPPTAFTHDYVSQYLAGESAEIAAETSPMQHQETIDKFLETDKISPVRINMKGKENDEENFVPETDEATENDFFSETLAKIYLKQKKYDRALIIIRKLNLIYPEKSRYFADQIRFLEKLIINTKKTQ